MQVVRKFELGIFVFLFLGMLWLGKPDLKNDYSVLGDGERYIDYAVSLYQHGVFGLGNINRELPQSSNANAPFYSGLIAAVMFVDKAFAESLTCLIKNGKSFGCDQSFESFFWIQKALSVLCLYLIYLISLRWSNKRSVAWLSALMAFSSGVFFNLSYAFMTEILVMLGFLTLMLFCLNFYKTRKLLWVCAIGIILAVLTLVRPSYLYLFYGTAFFFIASVLVNRGKDDLLKLTILIVSFVVMVSPWAIRNKIHFDSFALTSGGYAEAILIQRTNYNQMKWLEVGAAMIYWLPDFGDSLAKKLFHKERYEKLGWGEGTYYAQQYRERIKSLTEELGGKEDILPYLIKEEVLTLKHIIVSIPLAFRGLYISKYWGLIGLIAFVFFLIKTVKDSDYSIFFISLPVFFMVAFHAGLSVSIPRYNFPLIMVYALSMAWYINLYGQRFATKIRKK